jgi:hypothetical protein
MQLSDAGAEVVIAENGKIGVDLNRGARISNM